MDFTEIYKALGATAGICSAVFLVWDRFLRDRPLVGWCLDDGELAFRVTNAANEDVYISSITIEPVELTWTWSSEIRDMGNALSRQRGSGVQKQYGAEAPPEFVLRPKAEKVLRILHKGDDLLRSTVTVTCHWSFMRSRWQPTLPVRLVSKDDQLTRLKNAKIVVTSP